MFLHRRLTNGILVLTLLLGLATAGCNLEVSITGSNKDKILAINLPKITPTLITISPAQSVIFSGVDGSAPYTFSVVSVSGGTFTSTSGTYTAPATEGDYIVRITDSLGNFAEATVVVKRPFWTWVSGANSYNQIGSWGAVGVAAASNIPSARYASALAVDASGNILMFGGNTMDSNGNFGVIGDLWKYDGSVWTWIKGSSVWQEVPVYGNQKTPAAANTPGGRDKMCFATHPLTKRLWIFGGTINATNFMNDLWEFNGTDWVWLAGDSTNNQVGVYGTMGITNAANKPGARYSTACWFDEWGNFWLFGGSPDNGITLFDDLWKYDGTNWTWMAGSNSIDQLGNYGTQGVTSPSNLPGARRSLVGWYSGGNHYIFGGRGFDSTGAAGILNDVWRWDGANWTWIKGSNLIDQLSSYGTINVTASSNTPGSRNYFSGVVDSSGHLILFGGGGFSNAAPSGRLGDLWRFNGTDWTWIGGSSDKNFVGVYGMQGVPSPSNEIHAGRYPAVAIGANDKLWVFGGDFSGNSSQLFNDLWNWAR